MFYSAHKLNDYLYEITRIANLEDAADVAYSLEEMKEMLGDTFHGHCNLHIVRSKVVEALTALKVEMINKNKKSIKIDDAALIEALKGAEVSSFVKGLRRVGNRLSIHDNSKNEEKRKKGRLFTALIHKATHIFTQNTKIEVTIAYADRDRHRALELVKTMVTFDDIDAHEKGLAYKHFLDEDIEIMRKMWENLDDFFEAVPEQPA